MADNANVQVLDLPELPAQDTSRPKKTLYVAGETNVFDASEDRKGFITFDSARLINVATRKQLIRKQTQPAVSVTMGIVLDNPTIGEVDEDGNFIAHPMHTDPRYTAWQSLAPKRVRAQQTVLPRNFSLLKGLLHHLRDTHGWTIIDNPAPRENSQRKTTDTQVAYPPNRRAVRDGDIDPTEFGAQIEAFEVSVNPDYVLQGPGFSSFLDGVEEQRQRWETAFEVEGEKRAEMLANVRRTIHQLGGVHYDEQDSHQWWARPVDVGMLRLDGSDFPLYQSGGGEVSEDVYSFLFNDDTQEGAEGLALGEPDEKPF